MYDIYDLFAPPPDPLIPRSLRLEIDERVTTSGQILVEPTEESLKAAIQQLRDNEIESVVIAFLHSYRNPANEEKVADAIQEALPAVSLSLSSRIAPIAGEYERTSTAAADGFTKPAVRAYVSELRNALVVGGLQSDLHLVMSSGEIASAETGSSYPIRLLESGPASGAIAAAFFGKISGHDDVLSLDMGGTTTKACVIEGGKPEMAHMLEAARVRRFMKGSGLPIVTPVVDLIEIGAGGGSIARMDELGLLKVGPDSAGADPGPACYGLGGQAPTVSDANLVLGYLNPDYFLGGEMELDRDQALAAIERLASQLKLSVEDTAWGIHRVVNENMAAAARVHIIERNRDPRSLTVIAFGGAGPAHASAVARVLGSPAVVSPPGAGVASALGALVAPIAFTTDRTLLTRLHNANWSAVGAIYNQLEVQAIGELKSAGVERDRIGFRRWAEMRLEGQYHEIEVPLPLEDLDAGAIPSIEKAFGQAYRQRYGRMLERLPIEVIQWRLTATGPESAVQLRRRSVVDRLADVAINAHRPVYFPDGAFRETPVYNRELLEPGMAFQEPAIVEEREATVVIYPGASFGSTSINLSLLISAGTEIVQHLRVQTTERIPHMPPASAVESPPILDPVSLEIMWHRLINIADEMYTTVLRTAVSNAIGASQDFGCELLTPEGSSIAHAPRSMPVFNLIMPEVVRAVLRKHPLETMRPNDIYTTNDPWICAGHLDDIAVVTPIFRDGRIVAFASTVAHASSIGGALDGVRVKDLHEEGLFFPVLKLYDGGQPNETLFDLIRTNVRQPEMVLTDIESQVAANTVAGRRLLAFMDEYRLDSLAELTEALQDRAEDAMRRAIEAIPDGIYEAEEPIEGTEEPLKLQVRIEIDGSDIAVDYAGSSPQTVAGGVSCTFTYTRAHTVYPLKSLLTPEVPNNEGCFKPIRITAPERSILHAQPPASVNSRTKTGWHLHAVIFRALASALPDRIQAGNGLMYTVRIHARDDDGTPRIAKITCGGGRGAGFSYDGFTRNYYPSSASNVPIEVVENRAPVIVEEKTLIPDSGGQGRWRGAPGQRLTVRRMPGYAGSVAFYIHPDRLRFPPPGVFGGGDGQRNVIMKNGEDQAIDSQLKRGEITLDSDDDTFTSIIAGGGGYGDPSQRSRRAIERDHGYGYTTQTND